MVMSVAEEDASSGVEVVMAASLSVDGGGTGGIESGHRGQAETSLDSSILGVKGVTMSSVSQRE